MGWASLPVLDLGRAGCPTRLCYNGGNPRNALAPPQDEEFNFWKSLTQINGLEADKSVAMGLLFNQKYIFRLQQLTRGLYKVIDFVEEAVKFSISYYSLGDNE